MLALLAFLGAGCAIVTTALAFAFGAWLDHGTGAVSLRDALFAGVTAVIPIAGLAIAVAAAASRALRARLLLPSCFDEHTARADVAFWARQVAISEGDEGDRAGLIFLFIYAVAIAVLASLVLLALTTVAALPIGIGLAGLLVITRSYQSTPANTSRTALHSLLPVICATVLGSVAIVFMDLQNPSANKIAFLTTFGVFGMGFAFVLAPSAIDAARTLPPAVRLNADTPSRPDHHPSVLTADISLQKLSVRYSGQHPYVFRHLDLNIRPGSFVGFCGGSGSGKTTLCRIVLGLLDPAEGEVCFGDVKIPRGALSHFPDGYIYGLVDVSPVPQMSIEQIISNYGTIPSNRVLAAATATGFINDIATLPLGLRTNVGPGGSMLSTSQRQLLQLTAAVARRPEVLILDNPISALPDEERAKRLLRIKPFVTSLIVTSNSGTALLTADRVYAISDRQVVPVGEQKLNFVQIARQ